MTQKQVSRKLIDLLTPDLRPFDFEPSYKEEGFIRQTGDAFFLYQFLIYNRTILGSGVRGYLIEPFIGITVKKIERYYKQITYNTELTAEVHWQTIGNSLANIIANPDGLYKNKNKSLDLLIFEEKHIPPVAARLLKHFKEVALPYCFAILQRLFVELIRPIPRPSLYCQHRIWNLIKHKCFNWVLTNT